MKSMSVNICKGFSRPWKMLSVYTKQLTTCLKDGDEGIGEMALWVTAWSPLPGDLGLTPSIHMAAHNYL